MHDPRVLLDPATDAVRKLARRGYALDVVRAGEAALRAQRGDPARRRGPRGGQAGGPVGEGRERRGAARAGRARPRAEDGRRGGRGGADARSTPSSRTSCSASPTSSADEAPDGTSDADAELVRSWGEQPEIAAAARPRRPRRAPRDPRPGPRHEARGPAVRGAARQGRQAGAGAGALLPRRRRGQRLHRVLGADAGQPAHDDGHGPAAEVRERPVPHEPSATASCSSSPPPRCRSPTCTPARPSPWKASRSPTPPTRRATARRRARTARTPAG